MLCCCSLHFEVRDKWIPDRTSSFVQQLVLPLAAALMEGKKVLVHCNGGKGRTGTAVAAVLMSGLAGRQQQQQQGLQQGI